MHIIQSLFLDNQYSGPFSIFGPDFMTVAYWLLVTGEKGHERTRNARGRQLFLSLADQSVKYFCSIMPALWQSPKKEISVQKPGSDGLPWLTNVLVNQGCLHTVRNSSISSSGSLSLNKPAWSLASSCNMVFIVTHNPSPEVGSLTALYLMNLVTVMMKCYPRWKGRMNISWWIQDGLNL